MVENPNRKVEKLLPEERLGGNGLFARVTVFPGREIDYHEHHGETETYHIMPARAYTATTARSVPFTPVTRFSVTMAADTASATPGRMIWCSSRSLSGSEI